MSHGGCRSVVALLAGSTVGCGSTPTAPLPPPNVAIAVTPVLNGTFSGQPGTHQLTAVITDTLGNPLTGLLPVWTVVPASPGVSVATDGLVTVAASAPAGDYSIGATAGGVTGAAVVRVLPRPQGKLYFTAGSPNPQLYVKDFANDLDAVQLTNGTGLITGFAIDRVAGVILISWTITPASDMYRMNLDGSGLVNLTNDGAQNQNPVYHPQTNAVYFNRRTPGTTGTQIWKMSADGSGMTQLTTGTQNKIMPAISPDGQRLAWTEFYPGFNTEIVTAGILGNDPVRLTDRVGGDSGPSWLSNSRLAWSVLASNNFDIVASDVPPAGAPVNLTVVTASDSNPTEGCSPNTITFLSSRGGFASEAYQLDLFTGLVVKYTLPTAWSMAAARRVCQ